MSSSHATISTEPLRVIQFPHPGFQHTSTRYLGPKKQRTGVMEWKEEGTVHNRKYLVASGSVVDPTTLEYRVGVQLGFWGEWEAPSRWTHAEGRVESYHPSVFHEPLLPAARLAGPHQNTDPLVFGDRFLYTNCRMGIRRPGGESQAGRSSSSAVAPSSTTNPRSPSTPASSSIIGMTGSPPSQERPVRGAKISSPTW